MQRAVRARVEKEVERWELEHGTASQLHDELEALVDLLTEYPFVGTRTSGAKGHRRKIPLRVTGFVIHYRVAPRKRIITIVGIAPGPSMKGR